ncbi:fructose-1 [Quercus suber]|uniref:Fructose-1,6-bisphosphatase, cytosolic n=1 Tax=Quercus suber TaxID=58331 RepID=A0AAW0LE91_QUESU
MRSSHLISSAPIHSDSFLCPHLKNIYIYSLSLTSNRAPRRLGRGREREKGKGWGKMDHAAEANRTDLMTITRFVLNEQSKYPESRGDFTILLSNIVLGCKFVCTAVNKGEEQKKLDVLSNDVFVKALISSGRTCILVSEEDEQATFVEPSKRGRYAVVFDPLDGSSNIDCGVSIGTIFGIYMVKDSIEPTLDEVLQPGKNMLAAGYCMYGSSCTFVLSTGAGVNGFTLDPSLGEFILTHPDIKIPKKGKIYSVNEGNAKNWDGPTAKYVERCKFPKDGSSPKSLRYIGSMVADVHRTLLYGGIFLYPADKKSPNGKLRVLYEVFPMSFLMEQAGGQAFTGKQRALDLVPNDIHERSPIFLGSYEDVEEVKALYAAEDKK